MPPEDGEDDGEDGADDDEDGGVAGALDVGGVAPVLGADFDSSRWQAARATAGSRTTKSVRFIVLLLG
jgi:hypothetical protein